MKRYIYFLFCLPIISCSQNSSKAEKDYINNLEEKNRILEKELEKLKSKPEPTSNSSETKEKSKVSKGYFTIGSTEDEVLEVMGTPTSYDDLGYAGKIFRYGLSSVSFEKGKVESYNNLEGNLKVRMK